MPRTPSVVGVLLVIGPLLTVAALVASLVGHCCSVAETRRSPAAAFQACLEYCQRAYSVLVEVRVEDPDGRADVTCICAFADPD